MSSKPAGDRANTLPLIIGTYVVVTSLLLFRLSRAPMPATRKWEQGETVLKATTLGAVIAGIAATGGINRRRSEAQSAVHT